MPRLRTLLDLVVTILVAVAACAVIWRSRPQAAERPLEAAERPSKEPPLPTSPLSLGDAFTLGSQMAPVALIEFGDFECPFCRRFEEATLPAIERNFVQPGKVLFAFKSVPLTIHPHAKTAAKIASCAARQGRFWAIQGLLFERIGQLEDSDTMALFARREVDVSALSKCVATPIGDNDQTASAVPIKGTPTFFVGRAVNGSLIATKRIEGAKSISVFAAAINTVLTALGDVPVAVEN